MTPEIIITILVSGLIGLGFKIIYDWLKAPREIKSITPKCEQDLREMVKTQDKLIKLSEEAHDKNIKMLMMLGSINETLKDNGKILKGYK